ncbi:Ferredoxin--NADP(+) reductase [hydrothermal vent metagenome]|uniref:ferredoxin--NADP(+) reductase n=1 Tax=hydrothermal vent metagenome TaxID=652676 RepID=A0A3B1BNR0_9ZZZZ
MAARVYNAVVSEPVFITSETMILRVTPDGWELPDYIPGQFAVLGLPGCAPRIPLSDPDEKPADPDKFIARAYSIASSSKHKDYLEFYVTLVRSGALTPRLFSLKRGDRIHLGKKMSGMFTLSELPQDINLVLMATGTGVAPYMSMIRTLLAPGMTTEFTVVHGARHSWDLGYRSELTTLDRMVENFTYLPMVSRPDDEIIPWGGETGYVQSIWQRGVIAEKWGLQPTPKNTHIFLCGNPGMVTAALEIFEADGFTEHSRKQPGQVHLERYW